MTRVPPSSLRPISTLARPNCSITRALVCRWRLIASTTSVATLNKSGGLAATIAAPAEGRFLVITMTAANTDLCIRSGTGA